MRRILHHPILGERKTDDVVTIYVDGKPLKALKGEMVLAALLAYGIRVSRTTRKTKEKRAMFCGIGRCTDCVMNVNGVPNVRTCVTEVQEGMVVETQTGLGEWKVKQK